jgi:sugar (pentulose or hexulose) kinase
MTRDTLDRGIDVGTSCLKAVLLDPDGNMDDEATASYGLRSPRPGWTEQDPDDWWTATREALVTSWSHGNSPGAITGVGQTGQLHSLTLLDAAGNVLATAMLAVLDPSLFEQRRVFSSDQPTLLGQAGSPVVPQPIQSPGTARPESSR